MRSAPALLGILAVNGDGSCFCSTVTGQHLEQKRKSSLRIEGCGLWLNEDLLSACCSPHDFGMSEASPLCEALRRDATSTLGLGLLWSCLVSVLVSVLVSFDFGFGRSRGSLVFCVFGSW